jgi:Tol biopolymer transport system component
VLWPSFLPDGQRFLYLEKSSATGRLMLSEPGKAPREVMSLDSNAQYLEPGYVLFAREGILLGQKVNPASLRPEGEPFSIAKVVRMDRSGREGANLGTPGENARVSVSRDGQTAVFDRLTPQSSMDIWSIDLARGIETRLTSDPATEVAPVLVPGTRVMIFASTKRGGPPNLVRKNLDSGVEEFLLPFSPSFQEAEDVTRDGRTLLFFAARATRSIRSLDAPAGGRGRANAVSQLAILVDIRAGDQPLSVVANWRPANLQK